MSSPRETRDIPTNGGKRSNEELGRELDRKASKEWARGKFEVLSSRMKVVENIVEESKTISLKAKSRATEAKTDAGTAKLAALNAKEVSDRAEKKAKEATMANHECVRTDTLTNMRADIGSWTNWWRRTMITVVAAIVIFGAGLVTWLYLHKSLSDDVEIMKGDVVDLKGGMGRIEASQEKLRNQKPLTKGDVESAFKEVVEEMKKDEEKPKGRKGR